MALDYLFDDAPEIGELKEVAPGIHWLRMPLPMALNHINLWLIEDGSGWTLIDTGLYSGLSKEIWNKVIDEQLGGRPLKRIIVTHFHPDHVGMAGWLVEKTGAEFWMPRTEWLYARVLTIDTSEIFTDSMVEYYRRAGGDSEYLAKLKERGPFFPGIVSDVPRSIRRIVDGESFPIDDHSWKIVVGNGHSPEHACLQCDALGLFISGDLILPKISPHIGVYADEPNSNPLKDYLETLDQFKTLPGEAIVLPSHNEPFRGLHERRQWLIEHHRGRLEDFTAACATPTNATVIAKQVFKRRLDSSQIGFAIAETVAHLNYLIVEQRVTRLEDKDGVHLYQAC